jgi:hypothetical protein
MMVMILGGHSFNSWLEGFSPTLNLYFNETGSAYFLCIGVKIEHLLTRMNTEYLHILLTI